MVRDIGRQFCAHSILRVEKFRQRRMDPFGLQKRLGSVGQHSLPKGSPRNSHVGETYSEEERVHAVGLGRGSDPSVSETHARHKRCFGFRSPKNTVMHSEAMPTPTTHHSTTPRLIRFEPTI